MTSLLRCRVAAIALIACACAANKKDPGEETSEAEAKSNAVAGPVIGEGMASFYSDKLAGNKTASGEPYDPGKRTCAHRRLPFGTKLVVERVKTGKASYCVVNDRGPFHEKRIIDLSRAVAEDLEIEGVAKVRLRKAKASP